MGVVGRIFNIQRYSTHDGPGIRTTVFLQGCPLRCFWCQNPESQPVKQVLMYSEEKCIACGTCANVCGQGCPSMDNGTLRFDRSLCTACGKCAEGCPVNALTLSGRDADSEDVIKEAMKDYLQYLESGGGLTLSGGEPFLQPAFAKDLLRLAKENGLNTLVETCGNVPWESINTALPYVDAFYWDIKKADPEEHRMGTGVDNRLILENARKVADTGKEVRFRMPLIPEFNDTEEEVLRLRDLVVNRFHRPAEDIDLLKYNKLGEIKYVRMGNDKKAISLEPQSDEYVNHLLKLAREGR